jgi:hypothetical protein
MARGRLQQKIAVVRQGNWEYILQKDFAGGIYGGAE